jgi:hypothetical protein
MASTRSPRATRRSTTGSGPVPATLGTAEELTANPYEGPFGPLSADPPLTASPHKPTDALPTLRAVSFQSVEQGVYATIAALYQH